ncbi:cysteine proteinase [Coprinopsis marcescibilis]|uniref:ubiquitinyl hydrolase 1 n=1 Tax=Coprinopsis marcescibilis TaxID=230819 RepID=A0A5C3KBS4_COPMA|nr:cysteine proteinase [Coprinopsis marcescibilis]
MLDVQDFDDGKSTGTSTPCPPTPRLPPPGLPPPVPKSRPLELPLDDDGSNPFLDGGLVPPRAAALVAFDLGSKHDAEAELDILNIHTPFAQKAFQSVTPSTSSNLNKPIPSLMTQLTQEQTTEAQLKEYSTAEVYDKNQQLYHESIPDVPIVSVLSPISLLREEYEKGSQAFVKQIDWLKEQGYTRIRRARGDGDCFYRSLAFRYVEKLLESPQEDKDITVASSLSILSSTRDHILQAGTDAFILEEPYETITSIIQNITTPNGKGLVLDADRLLARFQDNGEDEEAAPAYITYYLRMITSAHIKNNSEQYEPFFYDVERDEQLTVEDFCSRHVDPVGVEADHVQMQALCKELQINLEVAYLDGHSSDSVNFHHFNEGPEGEEPITLLYRQNEDVGRVFMNLASRISQVLPRFRTDDIRVPIQLSDTFTGLSLSRFMNLVEEDYERSEKVVQLRDELIKQLRQARRAHLRERFPQLGGGWTE